MAQENVYDNRSIVVKYIHHKLWKKGYVWEVNGHDDSVSNGLMMGRQEDSGVSPSSRHDPYSALHKVLREAGDELERLYQSDFAEMSKQLHLTSITAHQRFTAVIDELFRDGVNWGRIIAFFEFGGTVCVECVNKEMTAQVDNIAGWMTEYLNGPLHGWIQENGGWEAFVDLYGRQRDSVFRSSWSSIVTVFGLAALGAVGLTIGAYLAQK
ncbi:apoptosis regulator Bcl-2-like protein [Labeo rohita]|uniref:Apoptosis regulator Bcl-2 n=2 Tax=Labeonini TaxID=2743697 RepID=A0A498N3U7_LABRO|nr:apoptosis regulator Bcl-2 [Labeo rohita]RXN27710.1 apoptosis regulator Bcl-2-like protein [Labeo rohita]